MLSLGAAALRAFQPHDLAFLLAARNDVALEAASQPGEPLPVSSATFEARIERGHPAVSSGGDHDLEFIIARVDDPDRNAVGVAGLYEIDRFNRIAEVGVSVFDPAARRLGLGLDSYLALSDYAFRYLGLAKVYAHVKSDNSAALAAARRLGYTPEGVLRAHRFTNGRRVDLHVFGFLAEEWRPELAEWRSRATPERVP